MKALLLLFYTDNHKYPRDGIIINNISMQINLHGVIIVVVIVVVVVGWRVARNNRSALAFLILIRTTLTTTTKLYANVVVVAHFRTKS